MSEEDFPYTKEQVEEARKHIDSCLKHGRTPTRQAYDDYCTKYPSSTVTPMLPAIAAIGQATYESLREYLFAGQPPGSFGTALMLNQFTDICGLADDQNRRALYQLSFILYNLFPHCCRYKQENINKWVEQHWMVREYDKGARHPSEKEES